MPVAGNYSVDNFLSNCAVCLMLNIKFMFVFKDHLLFKFDKCRIDDKLINKIK